MTRTSKEVVTVGGLMGPNQAPKKTHRHGTTRLSALGRKAWQANFNHSSREALQVHSSPQSRMNSAAFHHILPAGNSGPCLSKLAGNHHVLSFLTPSISCRYASNQSKGTKKTDSGSTKKKKGRTNFRRHDVKNMQYYSLCNAMRCACPTCRTCPISH